MNLLKLTIAILSLSIIGGCGNSEDTPATPTKKLNVRVIDGYLFDALVWLDVNKDGNQDADEPQAWTDINGRASLDITNVAGDITDYPIISKSIKGKTIDTDAPDVTIARNYQMKAFVESYSPDTTQVITPITTLLNVKVSAGQSKEEAQSEIRSMLKQPDLNFDEDYIATGATLLAHSAKALAQILPEEFDKNSASAQAAELSNGAQQLGNKIATQLANNQEPSLAGIVLYKNIIGEIVLDVDSDGDGVANEVDKFPSDPLESADFDNDGIGDNADLDDDGDNVADQEDAFPLDTSESLDTDQDGTGNNADSDDDGDGVADTDDAFPLDPTKTTESDGTGNVSDSNGVDNDNDGFSDLDEIRLGTDPKDSSSKPNDSDSDGVADIDDAFPLDRFETRDTNSDGWGDFASSDDDGDGVPDSIDLTPTGAKTEFTEALIYYKRADTDYAGWGLHIWNNDSCDAVASATEWNAPYTETEDAGEHGVLFRVALKANHNNCLNFVIHKAGEEGPMGNQQIDFNKGNNVYTFHDSSILYYQDVTEAAVEIREHDVAAHWLAIDLFAWDGVDGADHYELWTNDDNSNYIEADKLEGYSRYALTGNGSINDGRYPHLNGRAAYSTGLTAEQAKLLLKKQLLAVALDADGKPLAATRVQIPFVLDALYTTGEADADEARMGAWIEGTDSKFHLWAPTAQLVELYLYDANKTPLAQSPITMTEDPATGIWSYTGDASLVGSFYRYRVQVFHPRSNKTEWVMVTDPYSVSLSTDSFYSQLVDFDAEQAKPAGWDDQEITPLLKPEDNIIYELHIRDFSGSDTLGTPAYNGKYLAFTEAQRDSVKQLQSLRDAGLNTIHLLPSYDIATIAEAPEKRMDLSDNISKLCDAETGLLPQAAICASSPSSTLGEILAGLPASSSEAQALLEDIRGIDGFNWGYDPYHYNAPEGSYAVESDGVSRILEYRKMVKTLHGMGYRVVQDVVFNHTSASGLYNNSVLDKVVPGYYHRLNADNGYVESSTCCDNTASEHRMFEKLVADSLVMWAENYKIDGFRFDLMGHLMKSSVVKALDAVKAVDADTWFYGEGWDFGEVYQNARGINCSQWNMAGTGIGTYNDRLRDAVRGAHSDPMNSNPGFANAGDRFDNMDDQMNLIRLGMTGNLQDYPLPMADGTTIIGRDYQFGGHGAGYAADPQEAVNYVSKHDNQTLWDIIQYKAKDEVSKLDRARMQILGLAPVMLGQGVPFLHMGTELLRSKSMERDSYDSGDWYNRVDFSMQGNNWNVGLPRQDKDGGNWDEIRRIIANANTQVGTDEIQWADARFKELLTIRAQSALLRLGETEQILKRVKFHAVGGNAKAGTIIMSIDDGVAAGEDLDSRYEAIVVAINASIWEQTVPLRGADAFELHPALVADGDERVLAATASDGNLTLPGLSVSVFVIAQQEGVQGLGMDQPVAPLYLRGEFNGWRTDNAFTYKGLGIYETTQTLNVAETVKFKLASSDWGYTYAGSNLSKGNGSLQSWDNANDTDGNSQFTVPADGSYRFVLDLSNESNARLSILPAEEADLDVPPPFGDEALYLRGTLTDWNAGSQMIYIGDGKYRTSVYLRPGEYQFKLASADWSTVILKNGDLLAAEGSLALQDPNNNEQIQVTVTESGLYTFELDAKDLNDKILAVKSDGSGSTANETMMQYFHWYNTEEDNLWNEVEVKAQALADVGITALWLPPAYKAMKRDDGKLGVGYSTYDLYDLGEFDQQTGIPTKYGDKDQYLSAITTAQNAGIQIYADIVLNHKMGADATEQVTAVRVNSNDRNSEYGGDIEIAAWTQFDFAERNKTYSDFKWHWYHFDGVDWDQTNEEKSIFKFRGNGKAWDTQVSSEFVNYDYLMGADLDMNHPDVVDELKKWGEWYVTFAGLDGLRLDAIKHIDTGFFNIWLDSVRSSTGKRLFTVGEYWDPDLGKLQGYLKDTGYRMSLFDAPLHYNFQAASNGGGGYDMGSLMNGTLMQSNPAHAVTLVENHDTQSLQALESPVNDWFKPLAYAFILLRQEGYPNVFYADYYGAIYTDKGKDGNYYTITMESHKIMLDKLLTARRDYAYGKQISYLNDVDVIGWTRQGDTTHPQGMAVLMTDAAAGTKVMSMGAENADECFVDITGQYEENDRVCTDADGNATFKVKGGSVSVWVGGYDKPEPDPEAPTTVSVTLTCANVNTYFGESVYAVGSVSELGEWNDVNAVALSSDSYPNWIGLVDMPVNTAVEWKCIKKAGSDVQWSSGANNSFTTPASGTASSTGYF